MPRVKKAHMDPDVVAAAHARVAADPRGAPEVLHGTWMPAPEPAPVVQRLAPQHALEDAPIGSKAVVSRTEEGKAVRLLRPDREPCVLPTTDPCYTLPSGCKIRKAAFGVYEGFRLGEAHDALFSAATVAEAITEFQRRIP